MSMGHLSHDNYVSQSHFSFSQGLVLRSWGCVLVFSCLSLGYLLCRCITFVTCRDRESWWWFFCSHTIFIVIGKYPVLSMYYDETIHKWRLWWLPSVVCGILFKDINSCSIIWCLSMNSAGKPHFHVPCPSCCLFWLSRRGTATLFVNVFTLFAIINKLHRPSNKGTKLLLKVIKAIIIIIAAEEHSVEHAKVFNTRRVPMWERLSRTTSPVCHIGSTQTRNCLAR